MPGSRPAEHRFEFLPEVLAEAQALEADVRRAIAALIVELHENPSLGEPMDDRPPRVLEGCRKVRFDIDGRRGKPRFRLVYRNEPSDGAVGVMAVLAIGERRNMIAYAKAAGRLTRRLQDEGLRQVRGRRPEQR